MAELFMLQNMNWLIYPKEYMHIGLSVAPFTNMD